MKGMRKRFCFLYRPET